MVIKSSVELAREMVHTPIYLCTVRPLGQLRSERGVSCVRTLACARGVAIRIGTLRESVPLILRAFTHKPAGTANWSSAC
jgi:hypothetical protein